MSAFIDAFRSKRVALCIPLGFVCGLPFAMRGSTLTGWMADVHVDLKTIAFFTWIGLIFTFKPLWAPLVDRYRIPLFGRRRGWMFVTQLALMFTIAAMGFIDPHHAPLALAALAAAATFLTATQDIANDAYRADMLAPKERASGSGMYALGYRGANIIAGAGALALADYIPWSTVYPIMAALIIVGLVATWRGPEPESVPAPRTIRAAVVDPLKNLFSRRGAVVAIAFIMFYKFGDYMVADMNIPFLLKIGFSKVEIAGVLKVMGMIASIAGTVLGGGLTAVLGVRRALLLFGVLQALMNVGYLALALVGKNHYLLVGAISIDWFCGGLAQAAFSAYQISLCDKRFTATQFALIAAASTVLGRLVGGFSGHVIEAIQWSGFFVFSMVVAIPGLALILFGRLERAVPPPPPEAAAPATKAAADK
jgi:MFS transporter, PAT family, beta-lactamase induction signal transducer AmpG